MKSPEGRDEVERQQHQSRPARIETPESRLGRRTGGAPKITLPFVLFYRLSLALTVTHGGKKSNDV
jgi:hypothetical protein